jgi:PleD family two-component response regulator
MVSVLALAVDRLDALTAARGRSAKAGVLAEITAAMSQVSAPIGVVAAVYPDGVIVLVAPRMSASAAKVFAHSLRTAVVSLGIANPEAIAADRVTASIGVVSANRARTELVADARRLLRDASADGGNRIASADLSRN